MAIRIEIEELRQKRGLTVAELAQRVGITQANLFVLKGNRAKAIRFSTLEALCEILECSPGDIIKNDNTQSKSKNKAA
jgi:putative transcriptional regulator